LCLLTENGANIQPQPLAADADHEITQRSIVLDPRQLSAVVNDVSVENGVSHVAVNDSHFVSTAGQSLSDVIRLPCVVQNVYSLSVQ